MSLQERLDAIRAHGADRIPPESLAVMHRATEDLRRSGLLDGVVKPGDPMPELDLRNVRGNQVRSGNLLVRGPLVVTFYRGIWWPYCNAELEALQKVHDAIRDAGATLVAISPQLPEHSAKIAKRQKLAFDVLSDPGNRVARDFGLVFSFPDDLRQVYQEGFKLDLETYNGDDSWTLPVPGRFIVDQGGRVRHADVDPDYTVRPEPSETVDLLKDLVR